MLDDKFCKERTIHAPRHIVPCRNREKRPRIVVKAHRIVKACGVGYVLAITHHAFRAVVKPPRRAKPQAWIMARERRKFPAVGRFIQCKKNDGEILLISVSI